MISAFHDSKGGQDACAADAHGNGIRAWFAIGTYAMKPLLTDAGAEMGRKKAVKSDIATNTEAGGRFLGQPAPEW